MTSSLLNSIFAKKAELEKYRKEDLATRKKILEILSQLPTKRDLKNLKIEILQAVDIRLDKLKREIYEGMGDIVNDGILKITDDHELRIERLEKHAHLAPSL